MYDHDFIRAQTAAMRAPTTTLAGLEPETRDQRIANHINAEFGCHKDQTRELVELLLERELPEPSEAVNDSTLPEFRLGAIITYSRKQTMVRRLDSDGDAETLNADLTDESPSGGNLMTRHEFKTSGRPATEAEVTRFLQRLSRATGRA